MFRRIAFCGFFLMLMTGFAPQPVRAADSAIGVVDVVHILTNAKAAKDIEAQREALREKFLSEISTTEQALRAEEKNLQEQRADMPAEEYIQKRKAYEEKLLQTRQDAQEKKRALEEASGEATDALREQLYQVVQAIAHERGYALVISNRDVIAGEKSLDITEETLTRLDAAVQKIPFKLEGQK
ncbi:MAG: OmpH family outer membrane protein [Magnetococcus sp. WYHC-3]